MLLTASTDRAGAAASMARAVPVDMMVFNMRVIGKLRWWET
jgi:hypothetical protein